MSGKNEIIFFLFPTFCEMMKGPESEGALKAVKHNSILSFLIFSARYKHILHGLKRGS